MSQAADDITTQIRKMDLPVRPRESDSKRTLESVLCADDDAGICSILRMALSSSGLDVRTARSGEQLIKLALERQPDVVLLDLMMPVLDGAATFKRMREIPLLANIPVIFLTAQTLPLEVEGLLRLGALGVITKPFDPRKLGDRLSALWINAAGRTAQPPAGKSTWALAADIDALAAKFLARAAADVVRLRTMLQRARQDDPAALRQAKHIAHAIHGTGAMLGFHTVSALSEAIEHLASGMLANAEAHGPIAESALAQQLADLTERLASAIEAAPPAPAFGAGMMRRRAGR